MDTAGFVRHRVIYGSGTGSTRHGYGVCGYGYGVGKPDPRVTRSKPYLYSNDITISRQKAQKNCKLTHTS